MSTCAHRGAARCWPCMTGGCYDTPRAHPWWDQDDVDDAKYRGLPAPSGDCGCAFCGTAALTGDQPPSD